MASIIVLDSSDEEVETESTSKKKSSAAASKGSNSKLKRSASESVLKLRKPEWHKFPDKSGKTDRAQKSTPNATQNGRPPDNVTAAVEGDLKGGATHVDRQPASIAGRVTGDKSGTNPSPSVVEGGAPVVECSSTQPPSRSSTPQHSPPKRKPSPDPGVEKSIKRVRPIQVSEKVDHSWVASQSPVIAIDEEDKSADNVAEVESRISSGAVEVDGKGPTSPTGADAQQPLNPNFAALLDACRAADPSPDMELIIKNKLLKYYHAVHPDFVASKGFCKTVKAVTAQIRTSPELVYVNLKTIVEELQIRRKSKDTVMSNEEVTTTGNEKKDRQVRRLSKALYIATKKIAKLEEADVDLADDNSAYLKCERFKKRACEIYEMICDLTGESKHAYRLVKKPIIFRGSPFPEFDKTLQSFVNRTNSFPDFFDVYRLLEHCNKCYCFGLKNDEMRRIAQDAFLKIGKVLQERRKTDLYETVSHFAGCKEDPADADPSLNAKLKENQKFHAKISTLIDRFAKEQEVAASESERNKAKPKAKEAASNPETSEVIPNSEKDANPTLEEDDLSKDCGANDSLPIVVENGESSPKTQIEADPSTPSTSRNSDNAPSSAAASLGPVEEIVISDGEDS